MTRTDSRDRSLRQPRGGHQRQGRGIGVATALAVAVTTVGLSLTGGAAAFAAPDTETEPNSTAATANRVTLGTPMRGSASVVSFDSDTDFYYFDVAATSRIAMNFTFDQPSAAGDAFEVRISAESGPASTTSWMGVYTWDLKTSDWNGESIRQFAMFLGAGRYYLRVVGKTSAPTWNSVYQFQVDATPVPLAELEVNYRPANATPISFDTTYHGATSTNDTGDDDYDYYAFDLPAAGPVTVFLEHGDLSLPGDFAIVTLRDSADQELTRGTSTMSAATTQVRATAAPAGRNYVRVHGNAKWSSWGKAYTIRVVPGLYLEGATLTAASTVNYTGAPVCPTVSVAIGRTTLTPDVNYTVTCTNNVEPGTGTVTVTGINGYIGTLSAPFTIVVPPRVSLAAATVSVAASAVYTGKAITPTVTVAVGGKTLARDVDYTLVYTGNVKVGKATVTVTGIGGYDGGTSKTFTILPKKAKKPKVTPGKKRLTVKWSAVPQAKSYTVSWRVAGAAKWKSKTVKAKVKSRVITGLKSKTKYDVRVRAITTIGKTKYVGAWSAAKRATVK